MKSKTPFTGPQIIIVTKEDGSVREERISENEAHDFVATAPLLGWAVEFEKVGGFDGNYAPRRDS